MTATVPPELRRVLREANITDKRLNEFLAGLGLTTCEEVNPSLVAATRELAARRRIAEERARQGANVATALRRAETAITLRTSPELVAAQGRGERLRARLREARHDADSRSLWIDRYVAFLLADMDAVDDHVADTDGAAADVTDPGAIPEIRRIRDVLAEHREARRHTNVVTGEED